MFFFTRRVLVDGGVWAEVVNISGWGPGMAGVQFFVVYLFCSWFGRLIVNWGCIQSSFGDR